MASAERELDWSALERLDAAHPKGSERKYLDARKWLARKLDAALLLGLEQGPPLDILDLGTGPGHFPFVAQHFGHRVIALDLPGIPLYDALCGWLGVEKHDVCVEARRPLPDFGRRFDLVTAFMLGFNTKADGTLFDLSDWAWFLDDVRDRQLKPGGRLLLKMIRQVEREGPKYGDPALMELFAARGARFLDKERYAIFEPLR